MLQKGDQIESGAFKKLAKISAPGKIILCGEHAVVYGYDALAMAIDLRCAATIHCHKESFQSKLIIEDSNGQLLLIDTNTQACKKEPFDILSTSQLSKESQNFAKVQYKVSLFLGTTGRTISKGVQYKIQISSDIPIGKCLGSSAAFNTVLAASLFYITGEAQGLNLEWINSLSKQFEAVEHGTPSGIDNYVSTFGGLVLFNNSKSPHFMSVTNNEVHRKFNESIALTLVDSGVEKSTRKAVEVVRHNYTSSSKYQQMIKQIGSYAREIVDLLSSEEADWRERLLLILTQNHGYLRQLGVSSPEIEKIVENFTIEGKQCAKITGAGMGGYVLIVNTAPQSFMQQSKYEKLTTKLEESGVALEKY